MKDREINIQLAFRKLPQQVKGATAQTETDKYKMIINSNLGEDEQTATFIHECVHILNEDFSKTEPVTEIEAKIEEQLKTIAEEYLKGRTE